MGEKTSVNLNLGSIPLIILLMAIAAAVVYGNTGDATAAAVWAGGIGGACFALPFLIGGALIVVGILITIASALIS